jgi:hypothetical protein
LGLIHIVTEGQKDAQFTTSPPWPFFPVSLKSFLHPDFLHYLQHSASV